MRSVSIFLTCSVSCLVFTFIPFCRLHVHTSRASSGHRERVLDEFGDVAAVAGAFVCTRAKQHQRGSCAQQSRRIIDGVLRVRSKLDGEVTTAVMNSAESSLPDVTLPVATSQRRAIPLRGEAANGLVAHIDQQDARLAHQAF
jgi:hypothetical protein